MATEAIPRFPLAWPTGWRRTHAGLRHYAKFSTRQSGQFSKSLSVAVAVDRLQGELDRLGAKNATLSTNVQLRLDGIPRSDNEPSDPGAAVYFSFNGKATVFACDKWRRVADNIAALAAHIYAVRGIERYGVGSLEQALAGYKALPADTAADWRKVFGFSESAAVTAEQLQARYKELAAVTHPDTENGNHEAFVHLGRAKEFALSEILQ